jgi:hypothetical protein
LPLGAPWIASKCGNCEKVSCIQGKIILGKAFPGQEKPRRQEDQEEVKLGANLNMLF